MTDTHRSLRCRLGWHTWRYTWLVVPGSTSTAGRFCARCNKIQRFRSSLVGPQLVDTDLKPREDAHGYY